MVNAQYLFRGVSEDIYRRDISLLPKGTTFSQSVKYGSGMLYGSGIKYGESRANAIIKHQTDSSRFPTSGVSTTPYFFRAKYYALNNGKNKKGYVYKIDRTKLQAYKVTAWRVSDFATRPQIIEDDEFILVAKDNGKLPSDIVVETIEVLLMDGIL